MSDVAGKSVLDLMWERLDAFVDELMAPAHEGGELERVERKGHAYGMAEAIALITNPYHSDIDAVRADAMERWELRQGVSDYQGKLIQETVRKHNERIEEPQDDHPAARRYEERRARRLARRAARNS